MTDTISHNWITQLEELSEWDVQTMTIRSQGQQLLLTFQPHRSGNPVPSTVCLSFKSTKHLLNHCQDLIDLLKSNPVISSQGIESTLSAPTQGSEGEVSEGETFAHYDATILLPNEKAFDLTFNAHPADFGSTPFIFLLDIDPIDITTRPALYAKLEARVMTQTTDSVSPALKASFRI